MSAPLSALAWEVLRALTLGLKLAKDCDQWTCRGAYQNIGGEISDSVFAELRDAGFIETHGGVSASITVLGCEALRLQTEEMIRDVCAWILSHELPSATS